MKLELDELKKKIYLLRGHTSAAYFHFYGREMKDAGHYAKLSNEVSDEVINYIENLINKN